MSYQFAGPNNILKKMRAKKVQLLCTAAFSLIVLPGLADAKSRDLYYSRIKPWLENASRENEVTEAKVIELQHASQGRVIEYQKPLPWLKQQNEARGLPAGYVPSYLNQPKETQVTVTVSQPQPVVLMNAPQEIARNPEPDYIEEERTLSRNEEDHAPDEAPRPIPLVHRTENFVPVNVTRTQETPVARTASMPKPVSVEVEFEAPAPSEIIAEPSIIQDAEPAPVDIIKSEPLPEAERTDLVAPAEQEIVQPRVIPLKPAAPIEVAAPEAPLEPAKEEIVAVQPVIRSASPQTVAKLTPTESSSIKKDQRLAEAALYPEEETTDAEGDFDTASNVSAEELGEVRGGFMASNGMQIDIGFETRTLVDGAVAEQTVVPNIEHLKASDLQNLVQVNNAASSARKLNLSDVPNIMTIIQNSRNDVKIDSFAIMNIDVSNSARFTLQTQAPELFNIQGISNLR